MVDRVFSIPLVANLPVGESEAEGVAPPADARRGRIASKSSGSAEVAASDFLAGPENRVIGLAIATLLDEQPPRYNPLVIYGPPGTGKSHLARGLAAQRTCGDSASVVFATGGDFSRLLNEAIDGEKTPVFRKRFRRASLLILDDLTQLATKRMAQQELVHTLDAVLDGGGQVVITSRAAPERINTLTAALRSRLSAGLTVSLALPAAAARLALVERFASVRRIALPEAAARTLAEGLSVTAPELSGALAELHMQAELERKSIDVGRVRRFLADRQLRLRPSLRTIASLCAKYFGLKMSDLASPSRRRGVVRARGVAVYLARQLTTKSLEQIGVYFGGRDHTTVLHSFRSIESLLRTDLTICRAVSDIRKLIAQA